ncbi:AAA family ATPase [Noviherbaspirillum aridicola]|uniref:GTP-binding protein n=1 Tax=Noviherbaspirillum aridicola TaxID=2849687 RepID=A0ABQ4PZA8_9BURK|nr:AAA family ATPase [Noviherbaspirillum aridicola]GIZ50223.1 GTP-binding protein [Noviherbaspirillum aridicola]
MKLRRIVIEDFRKFSGRLEIDGLQDGINIFTGPNEAGKTSIASAIRAVFLERYRSKSMAGAVPWQSPAARPQVLVEFETGGRSYRLRKRFIKGQECELLVDGGLQKFQGDGAEEALSSLLRFSMPARGASTPEHGGIPGLLWIAQGQGHDLASPAGHAAAHLRQALSELAGGQVEQGEDVLIASVQKEMHKLLTPRNAQPTGEYAQAEADWQAACERLQTLEKLQGAFAADAERLARMQEECDQAARRRQWEVLAARAEQARRKLAALHAARELLAQLERLHAANRERSRLLQEREQQAQQDMAALDTLEQNRAAVQQSAEALLARCRELAQAEEQSLAALGQARAAAQAAMAAAQARQLREQRALEQEQLERRRQALQATQQLRAQLATATAAAAASAIGADGLRTLRALDAEVATLQAKMEATCTRIEYRLSPQATLMLGDAPLSGSGHRLLEHDATLLIPGVGELRIIPGASEASGLASALRDRLAKRDALLRQLGIASLAEGEARLAEHQALRREIESLEKQQRIHAPEGVQALADAIAAGEARLQALQARIDALPAAETACDPAAANEAVTAAETRHRAYQQQARAARDEQLALSARAASLAEDLQSRRQRLDTDEARERRAAAQRELAEALAQDGLLAAQVQEIRNEAAQLAADVDEDEADSLMRAADNQRQAHARLQSEIVALRARLEQQGATGLGEQLAEASAQAEQLGRRRAELAHRARGLARLHAVLIEERDKAVQKLQAPLVSRMEHYFRKLFPQAGLALGEQLTLSSLLRDGTAAEPEQLSFGTREQIGLLGRFAYADLLREAGMPTLLILDDAVVHTDAERRARIKRALRDAARRHQVLIFTCHPEDWDDMPELARDIRTLGAGCGESA